MDFVQLSEAAVEEVADRVAEEGLAITRKAEQLGAMPSSGQSLGQLLGLSPLARTVNAFDHDQRSHGVLFRSRRKGVGSLFQAAASDLPFRTESGGLKMTPDPFTVYDAN